MKNLKHCKFCEQDKTLDNFTTNNRNKDKKENKCKECALKNVKLEVYIPKEGNLYCSICKEEKTRKVFRKPKNKFIGICKSCFEERRPFLETLDKVCKSCKVEQSVSNFNKETKNTDKLNRYCKKCMQKFLKTHEVTVTQKVCNLCKYEKDFTMFSRNKRVKDGLSSYCKKCTNKNAKKYIKNKDLDRERTKQRLQKDPVFKLSSNTRNLIWQSFNRACKGTYKKSDKTENILGCTIPEFIEHLQALFTDGMTLENNGQCEECWHIDHKIPLATAKTEEDIIKLCHYTNLQPLWSRENISKGCKII